VEGRRYQVWRGERVEVGNEKECKKIKKKEERKKSQRQVVLNS